MDYNRLADMLFKETLSSPEDYEIKYPERNLPEGARVTRIAPSPTGFVHIGNLFGAITDERIAHLSGGVFMLRIEDTDLKRQVPGAIEKLTKIFTQFGLVIDEGITPDGEKGNYGPYRQRERELIYKTYAKSLVLNGMAYPCFATEEELDKMRKLQESRKDNIGYYGKYAVWRDASIEKVEQMLSSGKPYVLRFRSNGDPSHTIIFNDLIKGKLEFPDSDQDFVLLKSDGIPTYHFAHAVDDHLMRTSVVIRGEEWLSTLPWHIQLFKALGFKLPKYAHTSHMMKLDNGNKRKLSKRKDPEAGLEYYSECGYPVSGIKEYLMTVLNSNFEEWRMQNPTADIDSFPFSFKKMSTSGALFDMNKFTDISKNVISSMNAGEVYEYIKEWSSVYDSELNSIVTRDPSYTESVLAIGRGGKKPRKDIGSWNEFRSYAGFFYDELFAPDYTLPDNIDKNDAIAILTEYMNFYNETDDMNTWFDSICRLSGEIGYATSTKDYKSNPDMYKGHPGDTSMVLRIALCGRQNAPDLYSVMCILKTERIKNRLRDMLYYLSQQ